MSVTTPISLRAPDAMRKKSPTVARLCARDIATRAWLPRTPKTTPEPAPGEIVKVSILYTASPARLARIMIDKTFPCVKQPAAIIESRKS